MNKERKKWNDENIKQIVDTLVSLNYHCGNVMKGPNGRMEFWLGGGSAPVVALQIYNDDMGFELWKPLNSSLKMDETVAALKDACCIHSRD